MVLTRFVPGALAVLAGVLVPLLARADVYTWIDASGRMNVSNLAPPEGTQVASIIHSPPRDAAREEAARRAELQALNDRVTRLQDDLEQSRRAAALAAAYAPPPPVAYPPPVSPYASWSPPAVQYVAEAPPPPVLGCDYAWGGCSFGFGWAPWGYPAGIVVLQGNNDFRHSGPGHGHGARPGGPRHPGPVRPLGVSRRS